MRCIRRPLTPLFLLSLTTAVWLVAAPLGAQEGRPLEIDDQFRIANVGSPVVSPDGAWVAYTVRMTDLEKEASTTRLWMAPTAGGEALPMTGPGGSAGSPAWSPDGRWLSFLASRNGGRNQVWALDRRGGEAQPLTEIEEGVSGYRWSPDGTRLALLIRDPEPEDSLWTDDQPRRPWVIDRLQFKRDGVGYLTGQRHTHLYVLELASGDLRQLMDGPFDESTPRWSPDGRRIAFVSNRTEDPDANANSDLWLVDADAAEPVSEPLRLTTNPGSDSSPTWSPDGRALAYVTVVEPELIWYATSHLAVVGADGSGARLLTRALDRNVSSPRFSADGAHIYFRLEDSAENHVARYDLETGEVGRPVQGPFSVGGFDLGPGDALFARVSRTDLPAEIFASTPEGLARLTHVNDSLMATLRLGRVVEEHWSSEPGVEVEGLVYLPPGFEEGRRYPFLLRPHGGPVSQYARGFNFEAHLFAANGYVVLTPNPRGSSGYGQAFSAALWANWGNPDFKDVMAGVDHVIALGWADPDRMGVGGWSYGGILTDYVITQTDRFKAAISGASEVLYVANYGHDHYQLQWERELGLPWEGDNRETWERLSPFNRVDRITTPTLVMGGESDWNVPIQNSEQLYQALRRRGVPTELVVYPGQPHGLRPPSYRRDRHQRYLAWYARWLLGEGGAGS